MPTMALTEVVLVAMKEVCVGDGRPPHHAGGLGVLGDITCSCAGPSAGGASPRAGPGSSHRPQWGPGPAPRSPAAPGSASSGTGCRSAPLPGWTGTVGPEQLAWVGRIWKMYPTREASRPLPRPGVQEFPLEGLGSKRVRVLGGGHQGLAQQEGFLQGEPSRPLTVLLRSIRCLCTHCIFLSRARFSGSTTPAKPRFSSAYS